MAKTQPHVLIVDDEPQVREQASRALTECGFHCEQAGDGEEAYKKAVSRPFNAVVTDLRMPMRHGHALCKDLLKLPNPPQVLVLTALTNARLVRDLLSSGVHDVIEKPVQYDILAMKVLSMVEKGPAQKPRPNGRGSSRAMSKLNLLHKIESSLLELTQLFDDRLDDVFCDTDDLPEIPRSVQSFIRRMAENEAIGTQNTAVLPGHEARRDDRVTCYTTVTAVPVDRKWRPKCEPFSLALRDLSESGLRLLHSRATKAEYLALSWNATQLSTKQIRVVAKVMRVQPCGLFYDVGGQYVLAD